MRQALAIAAGLWLAGVLQAGAAPHMAIMGVRPDLLLTFGLVFSLQLTRPGATGVGFFVGIIMGGLVGANLTHYIVSRMFACFCLGWSRRFRFELTYPAVGGSVFAGTMLAGLIFMFTAAPRDVGGFLGDTIIAATYNGVLALPLYALIRWVFPQPSRRRI